MWSPRIINVVEYLFSKAAIRLSIKIKEYSFSKLNIVSNTSTETYNASLECVPDTVYHI